jgi:hypothetical protein
MDNNPHTYRITAEGIEGLHLDGETEHLNIESGHVREVAVRLEADPVNLKERSSRVVFRVHAEDDPKLTASEEARFLGPVVR